MSRMDQFLRGAAAATAGGFARGRRETHEARRDRRARVPRADRQRLRRRAARAARREFAPQIDLARQQLQQARHSARPELRSISGATNIVENNLDAAIKNLKSSGLRGQYLAQAVDELTSRRADVSQSEAFLRADARTAQRAEVQDARTALAQTRVDKQVQAAQNYNSALEGAFTDAQERIDNQRAAHQERLSTQRDRAAENRDERQDARQDRKEDSKERQQEIDAAAHEVQRLFALKPDLAGQILDGTAGPEVWAGLEELVRKAEGVGFKAAQVAMERLRALAPTANAVGRGVAAGQG